MSDEERKEDLTLVEDGDIRVAIWRKPQGGRGAVCYTKTPEGWAPCLPDERFFVMLAATVHDLIPGKHYAFDVDPPNPSKYKLVSWLVS